ncbi:tetraspanin Pls1 family [Armillaria solidipes]|uniref:Tetraspanin Pls1 family n=1 Tax=Armillaria solidipes TaxID=1076256 RepID=A0A2H3C3Y0_9AGAR|nr:tetraspanin Pls1 family [Armillaria solidipes]
MVSRKLMGVWACLDVFLLAAGAVSLALSLVWRAPNILMNMVLSNSDLTAGTVLAVALLVTFAISIAAVVQRNHVTIGFVILNYVLVLDALGIIVIGSFVWFFTLHERANFHDIWVRQSAANRISLQDQVNPLHLLKCASLTSLQFNCCGYFNATDNQEIGGTHCTQSQVDFLNTLDAAADNNAKFFCVTPITAFADMTLNNIFTYVYGFMAIVLCLLLASLCVINKRKEEERFKKMDAKRGGRGFV